MEDRHIIAEKIGDDALLFGVFDGHNGDEIAVYCKAHIGAHIRMAVSEMHQQNISVERALQTAVASLDQEGSIDSRLPKSKDVGSTACMVVMTVDDVWFVNVGDSRALLKAGDVTRQMTVDHKPMLQSESDRVRRFGGFLSNTDGSWRINGRLNLSRSIGDWSMRPFIVSSPTIKHYSRQSKSNEYIVIASDGLFDVMTNEDVSKVIDAQPHTQSGLSSALKTLVSESRQRGSTDNITIIYIGLFITSCQTRR